VGELIAARAVLGIGAAAIFPLALSVLPVLFDGPDRQRAVAAIGGASMLSFPIGPIVGGYLLDHFWWGSVFLINVPVVILALVAVAFLLPETAGRPCPAWSIGRCPVVCHLTAAPALNPRRPDPGDCGSASAREVGPGRPPATEGPAPARPGEVSGEVGGSLLPAPQLG